MTTHEIARDYLVIPDGWTDFVYQGRRYARRVCDGRFVCLGRA